MGSIVGYCEICNRQFIKYRSFHKRCSDKCRLIATEKKTYYVKKKEVKKKCLHCGEQFISNDSKKKYCSDECYEDHQVTYHSRRETAIKTCVLCLSEFETTHHAKVYCSHECYLKAKKEREKCTKI